METIQEFAARHEERSRPDGCGDHIILGKDLSDDPLSPKRRRESRSHIFGGYSTRLGVCLMYARPQQWRDAKRLLESAGATIRQDGDVEGTATFDPSNEAQSTLALKLIRKAPKIARSMSPEARLAAAARLAAMRASRTSQTAQVSL
jgi:hypothetical protein